MEKIQKLSKASKIADRIGNLILKKSEGDSCEKICRDIGNLTSDEQREVLKEKLDPAIDALHDPKEAKKNGQIGTSGPNGLRMGPITVDIWEVKDIDYLKKENEKKSSEYIDHEALECLAKCIGNIKKRINREDENRRQDGK